MIYNELINNVIGTINNDNCPSLVTIITDESDGKMEGDGNGNGEEEGEQDQDGFNGNHSQSNSHLLHSPSSNPSHLLISQLANISVSSSSSSSNCSSSGSSSILSTRSSSPAFGTLLPFLKKKKRLPINDGSGSSNFLVTESDMDTFHNHDNRIINGTGIIKSISATNNLACSHDHECDHDNNRIINENNFRADALACNRCTLTCLYSSPFNSNSNMNSNSNSPSSPINNLLLSSCDNVGNGCKSSSPIRTPLKEISVNIKSKDSFGKEANKNHFAHWSLRRHENDDSDQFESLNSPSNFHSHPHFKMDSRQSFEINVKSPLNLSIIADSPFHSNNNSNELASGIKNANSSINANSSTRGNGNSNANSNENKKNYFHSCSQNSFPFINDNKNANLIGNENEMIRVASMAVAIEREMEMERINNSNVTGGSSHQLPSFQSPKDAIRRIDSMTMISLLQGQFSSLYDNLFIVDCRYPYEYSGGHLPSAINICTLDAIEKLLFNPNQEIKGRSMLIFHCEFSSERAPRMALHVRNYDRVMNGHCYPFLFYPEVYVMDGGYKKFFEMYPNQTEPPRSYRPMRHPNNKEELKLHQKMKSITTVNALHGGGGIIGKHGKKLRSFSLGLELFNKKGDLGVGMVTGMEVGMRTEMEESKRISRNGQGIQKSISRPTREIERVERSKELMMNKETFVTTSKTRQSSLLFSDCHSPLTSLKKSFSNSSSHSTAIASSSTHSSTINSSSSSSSSSTIISTLSSSSSSSFSFNQQHVPISSDYLAAFLSSDGPEITSSINYQMDVSFD